MQILDMDPIFFDPELAIYHPRQNELMQDDPHEYEHFRNVVATFYNYAADLKPEVLRLQKHFSKIQEKHLVCFNIEQRIKRLEKAIIVNAEFCFLIVASYVDLFPDQDLQNVRVVADLPYYHTPNKQDISKLRITLKQFVRDWSEEGQPERDQSYAPIIKAMNKYLPLEKEKKTVLVPGCGLGRLVYELAHQGYIAQGNEFSYFMLLGSHFIMNLCNQKGQHTIHPFLNNFCNKQNEEDIFQAIKVPDVCPRETINENHQLSIVAGEFLQVYRNEKYFKFWDSIVTCFFIDTANNILEYIDAIHEILKPGGIWINFGPLEYHYASSFTDLSVELTWEEIFKYVSLKFEIIEKHQMKSTYNYCPNDMKKLEYDCYFFVCRNQI